MKLLVFSDSHGDIMRMKEIIDQSEDIDMIIHLGDMVRDAEDIRSIYPDLKVECVAGNNDWFSDAPRERILVIDGIRLMLTHGNSYGVKNSCGKIAQRGSELGVDAVLFGHTHLPYENYHGSILLVNPGSIRLPAAGAEPSYCVLEVSGKEIKPGIKRYTD